MPRDDAGNLAKFLGLKVKRKNVHRGFVPALASCCTTFLYNSPNLRVEPIGIIVCCQRLLWRPQEQAKSANEEEKGREKDAVNKSTKIGLSTRVSASPLASQKPQQHHTTSPCHTHADHLINMAARLFVSPCSVRETGQQRWSCTYMSRKLQPLPGVLNCFKLVCLVSRSEIRA